MKALRIIGIIALVGVVIGVVLVLTQPSKIHVEKSIVIDGSSSEIVRHIENFQSFNAWSPWSKASPETRYTIVAFEGFTGTFYSDIKMEPEGSGTKVTWIYDGNNNTFKEKAMWILTKGDLDKQYEEGLRTLKEIVERKSTMQPTPSDSVSSQ